MEAVYILLYCADENTCGRKSRGDEKQLIDLEWPNIADDGYHQPFQHSLPAKPKASLASHTPNSREKGVW